MYESLEDIKRVEISARLSVQHEGRRFLDLEPNFDHAEQLGGYLGIKDERKIVGHKIDIRVHNLINAGRAEPFKNFNEDIDLILSTALKLPPVTKQLLKKDITDIYRVIADKKFTRYLKQKDEALLTALLIFDTAGAYKEILPQIDDNLSEEDLKILTDAGELLIKKGAKLGNVLSFVTRLKHQQFLPCPNVI